MRWEPIHGPTGFVFSPRAFPETEQLRQRTPPAVRSPLSLAAVPADVMASGALLVVAGFAQDCTLANDITPSCLGCSAWFVTCSLWVCLLHAGVWWVWLGAGTSRTLGH